MRWPGSCWGLAAGPPKVERRPMGRLASRAFRRDGPPFPGPVIRGPEDALALPCLPRPYGGTGNGFGGTTTTSVLERTGVRTLASSRPSGVGVGMASLCGRGVPAPAQGDHLLLAASVLETRQKPQAGQASIPCPLVSAVVRRTWIERRSGAYRTGEWSIHARPAISAHMGEAPHPTGQEAMAPHPNGRRTPFPLPLARLDDQPA